MLNRVSEQGSVILRGVEIATRTLDIDVRALKFYVDNPRIYSFMRADGVQPTQGDILAKLQTLEHVRELVQDIRANGGLIDPLIVRDGDFVVLEGNSRLAAYHHLVVENPVSWGKVRCTLLPADIDEKSVFALLAQYHVKGRRTGRPTRRLASFTGGSKIRWSTSRPLRKKSGSPKTKQSTSSLSMSS